MTKKYSDKTIRRLGEGADYTIRFFMKEVHEEFGDEISVPDALQSLAVVLAHNIIDSAPNEKEAKNFWAESIAVAIKHTKDKPTKTLH